jgi:hypothetical protein
VSRWRITGAFGLKRGGRPAFVCFLGSLSVATVNAQPYARGLAPADTASDATCSSVTYTAPSGPRNSITYVLDKPYVCGQFANGDWFVVPDHADGSVVVTTIKPDYANQMNGWDANPDIRGHYYQSWDHRLGHFREPPSLPYVARGGTSIIKIVSMTTGCAATTCEQFGAVLTVLGTAPAMPRMTFRPPANGTFKPLLSTSLLEPSGLPAYPSNCCPSKVSAGMALARSKGFRNNYSPDSVWGYYMIPADNVGYQRAWGGDMWLWDLEVLGYLILDDPPPTKMPVLIAYVQQGIDIWGAYRSGGSWNRGGGGNGAGALTTYVFAAAMLKQPEMLADVRAANLDDFLEGLSFYLGRNGTALYGADRDTIDAYWGGVATGDASTRDMRDPHGYIDGGPVPGSGYEANLANQASYLSILLRAIPAFRDAWPTTNSNLTAIVGFGKRYHDHKTRALPDPCAPAIGTYKRDYGPRESSSEGFADCVPGSGRFASLDGSNQANRFSSFLARLYDYLDRRLPSIDAASH